MQPVAVLILITLPWLNPFALGPSPAAVPLLFSWACIAGLLIACNVRTLVQSEVTLVVWAWLLAGLLSSLMGFLQYFGATGSLLPWVNQTAVGEAYANLRQRNQFASLTNIGLVSLIGLHGLGYSKPVSLRGASNHTAPPRWLLSFLFVGSALLGAGNSVSSSRTGLVQLILVAILALTWGWRRKLQALGPLFFAGLTYAIASFLFPQLVGLDPSANGIFARLQDGGVACSSRLTLWSNVLHLIAQKPWAGWGWGELDYAHFITLYPGPRFCEILDNAHNLPLHLAVELGLPFAIVACGVAGWLVIRAKPWQETDATRQMAWAILALIMLHSMLEYPLWYGPFQMTFAICIWLLWRKPQPLPASLPIAPNPELKSNRAITSVLITGFALALLAFTAYAAWDYHRISQIYLAPEMRSEAYRDNTLAKAGASWLFRDQVRFAELTTTDVTPENALEINALAKEVQHFSPESRVVIKIIESAALLGRHDEVQFYLRRFKAAYPLEHERWSKGAASADAD